MRPVIALPPHLAALLRASVNRYRVAFYCHVVLLLAVAPHPPLFLRAITHALDHAAGRIR